jgi:drug/metabolite transporter (DMT)-like permease
LTRLRYALAADALLTALVGAVLLFFPSSLVDALGVPDADPSIYANLAGALLIGYAFALARASRSPADNKAVIEAVFVANVLCAAVLALWLTALDSDATATGKAVLGVIAGGLAVLAALQATALRTGHR